MKECPLRKICKRCGKSYGRKKYRRGLSGTLFYEHKDRWLKNSRYCSDPCKQKAIGERAKQQAEQRKQEQAESADRLNQAIHRFIYS